ncbi:MAG TPA: hypothetical protein EYG57_16590 [Planctomycetes bacterium]|nr:hypothetical protein [Planctomycetota bacterium]
MTVGFRHTIRSFAGLEDIMLISQSTPAKSQVENAAGHITVNAAFLQEIKEVNAELWDCVANLRQQCSAPISIRSECHTLVDRLEQLRDLLALQFSLEEAYGYFDSPANVQPALCRRAEVLRQEHNSLYREIVEICDEADSLFRAGKLAVVTTLVPVRFDKFFHELERHERQECELIVESACTDLGVGD